MNIFTSVEQLFDYIRSALRSCNAKYGSALVVDAVDVAAPKQEESHNRSMTHTRRSPQGSSSRGVAVINVRLVLEQQLANVSVALERSHQQRCHAVLVLVVDRGSALQ